MTAARAWILLHGTPLDPDVWSDLAPILRMRQPVHAPGVTPRTDDIDPQRAIAGRLAVELADFADRWDVVGHSFGGQVAIELALLAPDRVATLSIICSRDTPFPPFARTAESLRAGAPIDVDGALQRWFRIDEQRSDDRLVAYARQRLTNADRASWAAALDGIARYDRSGDVHLITAPTLLICAEHDPVSDPTAMGALAARLPGGRLEILPDARHLSPLIQPESLGARLDGIAARA